jgi:hypothetical protein
MGTKSKKSSILNREELYAKYFGNDFEVSHELMPEDPHIDVYTFKPTPKRNFYTIITGGMSDYPMPITEGDFPPRSEMLTYCTEANEEIAGLLRYLAAIPYRQNTWWSPNSTMNNGNPAQPFIDGMVMDHVIFIEPCLVADAALAGDLSTTDMRVGLLQAVFITEAECKKRWDSGSDSVLGRIFVDGFLKGIDLKRIPG